MLWELPDNRVSFDGRLDTVYSKRVMDAHWRLYAGENPGPDLPLNQARYALLPSSSRGVDLLFHLGWTILYHDPVAVVLVRDANFLPKHSWRAIDGGTAAVTGSVPFPDALPVLGTRVTARENP